MNFFPLFFVAWSALANGPLPTPSDNPNVALSQTQQGQAVLLDVREADEIARGAFAEAVKFPSSKVGTPKWDKFMSELDKNKPIYVYCAKGGRAEVAARLLREKGFAAKNIGGYQDLRKREEPTKSTAPAR